MSTIMLPGIWEDPQPLPAIVPTGNVVWRPLEGSQVDAMACPANHILYEGTRGPGKTDWQAMRFRARVGLGYGAFWTGIIFDRKYKNLEDIIKKTKRWFPKFKDGARFLGGGELKWVWPTGEELLFRHMRTDSDYWNYHGQEYPYIGWNELTKYATRDLYDMMMSCNRSSFRPQDFPQTYVDPETKEKQTYLLPEIPLEVTSTTNPFGPGHNWVKSEFILDENGVEIPRGKVQRITREVFSPKTQRNEMITKTRVAIFGSYKENIYLSPEAIWELESITDINKRKAWLEGDWDIVAGGAFDDVWDPKVHIIPRFEVPASWRLDRSLDWGSTKPYSIGIWARATGEEIELPNGKTFCPVKGSLIRCGELYGTAKIGTNKGLKHSARRVARELIEYVEGLAMLGYINGEVYPGPADNAIFPGASSEEIEEQESISALMLKEGVEWVKTPNQKGDGSRMNGLQLMRDAMENAVDGERPGLYVMDHCAAFIKTVPILPRDEKNLDDIDTESEDHAYDEARYRVLASATVFANDVKLNFFK